MTDTISEAAMAKAVELLNAAYTAKGQTPSWKLPEDERHSTVLALSGFIQQASDAAKAACDPANPFRPENLREFILPEPVDPLVDALKELDFLNPEEIAPDLRAAFAKHGLSIVEVK